MYLFLCVSYSVGGGELGNHLLMEERLNETDTIHVTSEVLQALVYLHDKQLVHMDLKVESKNLFKISNQECLS